MSKHSSDDDQVFFCHVRGEPSCKCGNDYQEVCKPSWSAFKYSQKYLHEAVRRSYEAHHLLCCASVSKLIADIPEIQPVVEKTQWCINHGDNLIALPMWEQTLRYYCSAVTGQIRTVTQADGTTASRMNPPPFQNLVQHNYGHHSYISEVDTELVKIANKVKENKKAHEHRRKQLKSELNGLVRKMRTELRTRGQRSGGTHAGWTLGLNGQANWFHPFSMAKSARGRAFPSPGSASQMAKKLQELVSTFLR